MTAVEQAAAAVPAAPARYWERTVHDRSPLAPSWLTDHQGLVCGQRKNGWSCTRKPGHGGRHIATDGLRMYAAWPGNHAPIPTDLDDDDPDPATIYAQNVADEEGLRHPSTLRALALTVVQLAAHHGSDHAALGSAVQQAITAHREDDQPPAGTTASGGGHCTGCVGEPGGPDDHDPADCDYRPMGAK